MRDGNYCYPLTVTDQYSRYVLACKALRSTREIPVELAFEWLFREYGLPDAIRTDNGVPFATIDRPALTSGRVVDPSHPEQNGQHERMHKTLKAEATRPPGADLQAQQRKFDRWRREFNDERPHESLGQVSPVSLYTPSTRPLPKKLEHPLFRLRKVSTMFPARSVNHVPGSYPDRPTRRGSRQYPLHIP